MLESAEGGRTLLPCGACDQALVLSLQTDSYGSETTWALVPGRRASGCTESEGVIGGPLGNVDGGEAVVRTV